MTRRSKGKVFAWSASALGVVLSGGLDLLAGPGSPPPPPSTAGPDRLPPPPPPPPPTNLGNTRPPPPPPSGGREEPPPPDAGLPPEYQPDQAGAADWLLFGEFTGVFQGASSIRELKVRHREEAKAAEARIESQRREETARQAAGKKARESASRALKQKEKEVVKVAEDLEQALDGR